MIWLLNIGLVRRALRETLPTTVLFAATLGFISGMLAFALPAVQARFMQRSFIPQPLLQFRNMLLGVNDGGAGSVSEIAFAIAWSHPIMLILLCAHAIIVCTRLPAGEIERGTIDVLMGLPISRWQLYISETIAWMITTLMILGAVYFGSYVGAQFIKPEYRPDWGKLAMVLANLGLVYSTVGVAALTAATIADRRGRAIVAVLVLSVGSLLINFLQLLWEPAEKIKFLSFLTYYRPVVMLRTGTWPLTDVLVLGAATIGLWILAGWLLSRRPLTTL